jgi:flagellar biosynthesis component FlhA
VLVQRAFALLLRERVWPRDPVAILEAMVDAAAASRDPRDLAEAARRVLVPSQLRRKGLESIEPLLLDPQLERQLADGNIDPALALIVRDQAEEYASNVAPGRAVLLCTGAVRPVIADFLIRSNVRVDVYSYAEVPPEIRLLPAGVIKEALPTPATFIKGPEAAWENIPQA